MANRALALKHLSDAIDMDSNGYHQSAFAKYLQSLQVLTLYLNEMFAILGFQKLMLDKKKEIIQVLSMIHECSDRVSTIVKNGGKPNQNISKADIKPISSQQPGSESPQCRKFPAFEKLQSDNVALLKRYQWRLERATNVSAKTSLTLELQRQLIENGIIAKNKYDATLKRLQKERIQEMELEMKKLLENKQNISSQQKEKQELYISALQYTKTETWPVSWALNSHEMSTSDAAQKILQQTVRCSSHPLSQWLLLVQTNIKREIDFYLKQNSHFYKILPGKSHITNPPQFTFEETSEGFTVRSPETDDITLPQSKQISLQKFLDDKSAEIMGVIETVLEIFYLIYRSLLPDDSEEICHRQIEAYVLGPIWKNLILLYRFSNLPSEYKVLQAMVAHKNSDPEAFGFFSEEAFDSRVLNDCVSLLERVVNLPSISEKLRIFVLISQKICGSPFTKERNRFFGADDLMPLLCFVVVKSQLPQLSSEVIAIEQLFDVKYMFGEEGYALSTFLTALKYIEIMKLIDKKQNSGNLDNSSQCSDENNASQP